MAGDSLKILLNQVWIKVSGNIWGEPPTSKLWNNCVKVSGVTYLHQLLKTWPTFLWLCTTFSQEISICEQSSKEKNRLKLQRKETTFPEVYPKSYWLSLIIGRVECISYSFSVYQGSLGWHFRSFCATRSQREAAIKDSGLVPHRALFRFLSLPEKEKSQHISTGTAVALIWGIFCKIPQFKVFVGNKLLVFGKKNKIYLGYNSFSG